MDITFIIQSILLGLGLSMDACAVSMANGLKEPSMKIQKIIIIASTFAVFQALMPLISYFVGHAFISYTERFVPWIALLLLSFIGVKMIVQSLRDSKDLEKMKSSNLTFIALVTQAIATSIDALSVGFTISDYEIRKAIICVSIIALVTLGICFSSFFVGKRFGDKLGTKAEILGGVILIIIGLEIFISGIFF